MRKCQQSKGKCPNCRKYITNIVGLAAPMGPKGSEEIDFKIPVVSLDMAEYPPFRSVRDEKRM